jgi:hypothetical protein
MFAELLDLCHESFVDFKRARFGAADRGSTRYNECLLSRAFDW